MNIQVNKEEDTDIFAVRFVSLTERDLFATGIHVDAFPWSEEQEGI